MTSRQFRRPSHRWKYALAVLASMLLLRAAYIPGTDEIDPVSERIASGSYSVRAIRDDGLLECFVTDDRVRWFPLRLMGIEIVDPAAAVRNLKSAVADRPVQLRFDRRRLDLDGVPLAYVFVDERFLCVELVAAGIARAETHPADAGPIIRQLKQAEQAARAQHRGVWATTD